MKYWFGALVALSVALFASRPAAAVTVGDTVTCSNSQAAASLVPCSATSATVGDDDEFYFTFLGDLSYAVDFDGGTFTLSTLSGNFRNASTYFFQDLTNKITAYSITSIGNITNFDASNIGLNDGVLSIDLNNNVVSFQGPNVVLSLSAAPNPVPEPMTWGMVALAAGVVGGLRRRHGPGERGALH